jgi:hypothetical protein
MQRYAATRLGAGVFKFSSAPKACAGDTNLLNVWSAARLQRKSLWMKESLRQCIRSVCGEFVLLAMMRYAAYLSYKTPRLCKSHLTNQVSGKPL